MGRIKRLGGIGCFALACSASSKAPPQEQVPPVSTLGPRAPLPASSALELIYAGPRGPAALGSSIQLLFNQPLRPLDEATASPPPALELTPAVPGEWQWLGSRALTFYPRAGHLPAATAYRVSVPAGTRALSGESLSQPYVFEFETPAPAVLETQPGQGADGEEPGVHPRLRFNQPVSAAALQRAGQLRVVRGAAPQRLAFSVRAIAGKPTELEIVPQSPLPLASHLEFLVQKGLRGSEGERPLDSDYVLGFDTYGPLRVVKIQCNTLPSSAQCDPEGSLWIELSNPVAAKEVRAHLSAEPALPLSWPEEDEGGESRYVYLPLGGALAAATSYRLTLSAGVRDQHGQALAAKFERVLATGNFTPSARLPISGEIFPAPLANLEIESRNAGDLHFLARRLEGEQLLDFFRAQNEPEQLPAFLKKLAPVDTAFPSPVDNVLHRQPIAMASVLGSDAARGAAWVGWRYGKTPLQGQLLQVTDLALTAKLSAQGSLVWVTRWSTGTSVPGATVELLGRAPKIARRYQTDDSGLALIPAKDFHPQFQDYGSEEDTLIVVRSGDDSSFRRVADFLPPWRIDPWMRLSQPERENLLLFSDRGIYRPGDTIELAGVLRREVSSGNVAVAARKLELTLEDPEGEAAQHLSVESNRFGTFSAQVTVPGSAALGRWRLVAQGFEDQGLGVNVAEYRPVEFKVQVNAAEPARLEGETAHFALQADYLFGSPMAGRQWRYSATRQRTSFAPPGSEGYVTSDDAYRAELDQSALDSAVFARAEDALSERGSAALSVPLKLPGQVGPEQVRLDAEVTDLSRQTVSASAGVLVHPAAHYVAIGELEMPFPNAPALLKPRVLSLSPGGERLARAVKLELVRRRWTIAREKTDDGWRTVSQPVDETQSSCELRTGAQPVSCDLQLKESGEFFVRASSPDQRGHVARAALGFYALGPGRASWADNDQRKLELVLDKREYKVGDKAKLLIKSPFQRAEALLTVERAGLYEQRRLTLEGPAPSVEIAIDERLRPNAFVAVHVLQGVQANQPPTALELTPEPGYRLGYAQLLVEPGARRLNVAIQGQQPDYRPGQHVKLGVHVTRADGKAHPAELTVYAVDEGVLALSNYAPPDPLQLFTRPRPLAVATLESRDALGRLLLPGPERDKGMNGGDGGGAGGLRSNFRTTAYFKQGVVTNAAGDADVEFDLPDNLTTYRFMAVAVSEDDRYGVGSGALVVNRPLTLRAALPRKLRAGDRLQASAIVTRLGSERGAVRLRAEVSGATLQGPAEQQLQLGADGSAEARFELLAQAPGELTVRFAASMGSAEDQVQVTRAIAAPLALEASALYGRTESAEAQALGDLTSVRRDVGGIDLELASTALVGLEAGLRSLSEYPYACTEQLASRILPLGPLAGLAERYGIAIPDRSRQLEAQVGEILRRQHGDGGFGLWPSSPESHPWASAYALWSLWQARAAGAPLPQRVQDQGVAYLRQWLGENANPEQGQPATGAKLATAALMLDVLATLEKPDPEYLSRLYERRAELPTFARALLLHAASTRAASGAAPDPAQLSTLTGELERLITLRGNKAQLEEAPDDALADTFSSEGRSEALALWALLSAQPAHPLAAPLAQGILDRRDGGQWQNTQEAAYSLLALDAYRRAQEATPPHFEAAVWLGDRQLARGSFESAATQPQLAHLELAALPPQPGNLIFQKQGAGALFYSLRLRYAPRELPNAPLERGFAVQKSQRSVAVAALEQALGELPNPARSSQSFAGGDLVLVDLLVTAPALRHYVVIEDPLPAGLEAIDASLATSSADLDVDARAPEEDPDHPSPFQSSWYRRELRDDRVLFFVDHMPAGIYHYRYLARATTLGSFVLPPTRVEEMYQPEVFGRTAAGQVEVR
ncbi:MAG TPA: MG2 domain-containing protein [Polyangiaceae bacterium]|nr:MG2 domain-containing protein [Polyangiaceae bacterium]